MVTFSSTFEVVVNSRRHEVGYGRKTKHCSETGILDRFWLEFSAVIPLAGRSGDDEGIEVFGGAEGIHSQAGRRWDASGGPLPQGWDQPGDLLQLEKEV